MNNQQRQLINQEKEKQMKNQHDENMDQNGKENEFFFLPLDNRK